MDHKHLARPSKQLRGLPLQGENDPATHGLFSSMEYLMSPLEWAPQKMWSSVAI